MAATPLRKITHKGEIEVQDESYQDLNIRIDESTKDYGMDDKLVSGDSNELASSNAASVRLYQIISRYISQTSALIFPHLQYLL